MGGEEGRCAGQVFPKSEPGSINLSLGETWHSASTKSKGGLESPKGRTWTPYQSRGLSPHSSTSQVPHQDDQQVQNVPDAAEVVKPVQVDFQDFLHHVVEDEDTEDDLTAHDEEVPVTHVADQLNCADLPGRDGPSCGWELYHQSVRKVRWPMGTGLGQFLLFPWLFTPTTGYRVGKGLERIRWTRNRGQRGTVGKGCLPQNTEKVDVGIVDREVDEDHPSAPV